MRTPVVYDKLLYNLEMVKFELELSMSDANVSILPRGSQKLTIIKAASWRRDF